MPRPVSCNCPPVCPSSTLRVNDGVYVYSTTLSASTSAQMSFGESSEASRRSRSAFAVSVSVNSRRSLLQR